MPQRSGKRKYTATELCSSRAPRQLWPAQGRSLSRAERRVATFIDQNRAIVTDSLEGKLARKAGVIVPGKRGAAQPRRVHFNTTCRLGAIVLGLAAFDGRRAIDALKRLNDLRAEVSGMRVDVG